MDTEDQAGLILDQIINQSEVHGVEPAVLAACGYLVSVAVDNDGDFEFMCELGRVVVTLDEQEGPLQ